MDVYLLSGESNKHYTLADPNYTYQPPVESGMFYLISGETDQEFTLADPNYNYHAGSIDPGIVPGMLVNMFNKFHESAKHQIEEDYKNNIAGITCVYTGGTPYFTTISLVLDGRSGSLNTWAVKLPNLNEEDRVYLELSDVEGYFDNSDIAGLRLFLYGLFH